MEKNGEKSVFNIIVMETTLVEDYLLSLVLNRLIVPLYQTAPLQNC